MVTVKNMARDGKVKGKVMPGLHQIKNHAMKTYGVVPIVV
jgi:hypothetical protein